MDYLKVFLVLAPQLIAGCLIYLLILKRDEVALVELLSIGGVFGIVTSTIFDQIFVNLQLPRIGWLVPLLVVLVVFSIVQKNQAIVLPKIQSKQALRKTILPILAISAAALGTEWFWLFPSGVLFCFAAFLSIAPKQTYSRVAIRLTNLAALIAGVIMIANRPKIWWNLNELDYPFFQGLSRSLATWGVSDYFLQSGTQTKYHWFTYAWIGLVERVATAETFFVLTIVAPVVFVVVISGVVWSLVNRYSITRLRTFASTLVVMTASSHLLNDGGMKLVFLSSPSQVYAFAPLLVAVFIFLEQLNDAIRKPVLILSILSITTMLSKVAHGLILVLSVSFAMFMSFVTHEKVKKSTVLSYITLIFFALLTLLLLMNGSDSQAAAASFRPSLGSFYWQLQGDARLLNDKKIALISTMVTAAFAILPIQLTVTNLLSASDKKLQINNFLSLGSLIAGVALSLFTLYGAGHNLYFLNTSIFLSTTLGFVLFTRSEQRHVVKSRTYLLLVLMGGFFCLVSYQIPNINSGAEYAIILRSMRIYAPGLLILTFTILLLLLNIPRRRPTFDSAIKIVVVSSAMVTFFALANWIERAPRKIDEFSRIGETYIANFDLSDLTSWMNTSTNENDIVASNYGWPQMVEGDFESHRSPCLSQRYKEIAVETCRRTTDAMLVAYMHRRTWLQATSFHYTGFTPEMDKRQTTTLGFAAEPNAEHLQQMESDGVTWYVVDRSTTDRTNWEPYATVRFMNDSFYVLELNTAD
jgi:hypothetical protein